MTAPRCRFCRCVLRSPETKARGFCRFSACIAEARAPADPEGWAMVRGESSRRERWATGRVRMTRARWLTEPEDYKSRRGGPHVLRLDPQGATTLYPVDLVDDETALGPRPSATREATAPAASSRPCDP